MDKIGDYLDGYEGVRSIAKLWAKISEEVEAGTAKLYHWEYDDGSEGAFIVDTEEEKVLLAKVFENAEQRKLFQRNFRKKIEQREQDFEKHKEKIPCGIQTYADLAHKTKYSPKERAAQLFRLLESCGKEAMAQAELMTNNQGTAVT